jgi:hypothetical protein
MSKILSVRINHSPMIFFFASMRAIEWGLWHSPKPGGQVEGHFGD